MRQLLSAVPFAFALLIATPAAAQSEISDEEVAEAIPHYWEMREASRRGLEMYLYDQAAWHATDRMVEDWGNRSTGELRGYIVVPGEGGHLDAVFYGVGDDGLVEFARYEVEGSSVVGGGLIDAEDRPALSQLAMRMVEARNASFVEASKQEYRLCNDQQPNTLVLPPDDQGVISAYLLTAPVSNDAYPIGGHYRIDVDAEGEVVGSRRFLNSCFLAEFGSNSASGIEAVAMVISHFLDPQPTEIHVFASYYMPISMMVMTTENSMIWSIENGAVGAISEVGDLGSNSD
jgi:hypothetical protein